jgi:hypothetical protein
VQSIISPWGDIAVAHIQVVVNVDDVPEEAFREQDALVNQWVLCSGVFPGCGVSINSAACCGLVCRHFLARYFKDATSWVLPALYVLLKDLRRLAQTVRIPSPHTLQHHIGLQR